MNQLLPSLTADLSPLQKGWLHMAGIREQLFTDLQNAELSIQGIITPASDSQDLATVQAAINTAKATIKEAKEKRLAFSRLIDEKLLTPAMEFEKRMIATIEGVSTHELELRKKAEQDAQKKQAHANELAAFKAHVTNEWYRIAMQYRSALDQEITATYVSNLRGNVTIDRKTLLPAIADSLRTITLPSPNKYQRTLVTDDEAKEVVATIRPYDPAPDLQKAIDGLEERFSMYENDLANPEEAAKATENEQSDKHQQQNQALAAEQATNVLIAAAETIQIDAPTVKRELRIIIIESEQWAMAVVANFMKNWQYVNKYVRVKSWNKLSIGQMADALAKHISETGEQLRGLQTEEVCK